jgi:hypothetical protein
LAEETGLRMLLSLFQQEDYGNAHSVRSPAG